MIATAARDINISCQSEDKYWKDVIEQCHCIARSSTGACLCEAILNNILHMPDTKVIGDPAQREVPKDLASVLDESAQTLFLTEMMRGLNLTLKAFFDQKVTVSCILDWPHPAHFAF